VLIATRKHSSDGHDDVILSVATMFFLFQWVG
jgi:hypothetical protein